jgi:hypothetical protein
MNTEKKYPLTIVGLYATKTAGNARSAILSQEYADKACAAIQAAVGGKLAVKATNPKTKAEKGDKFPDYFLEAVTPDLLNEERARMQAQNAGDDSL